VRRFVGLDLGGTNIKRAVLEATTVDRFEVVHTDTCVTPQDKGPDAVCARLVELGEEACRGHDVRGVGVGVPGIFTPEGTGVLFPNLPGTWPGFPIEETLRRGLGLPVRLINDARAATLAEATAGAAAGCSSVVCLILGTGIGGGVVVDGRIHEGRWGIGGEIGHQTVAPDGPPCDCGNLGCAEIMARASELARLGGRDSAADVFAGAREHDRRCIAAIDTVTDYLGIVLGNLVTVLGPDRIVVGGGIAAAGADLLVPLRRAVAARAPMVPAEEVELVAAALGPTAGAIGAAVAALHADPELAGR
jgi:glucokinase